MGVVTGVVVTTAVEATTGVVTGEETTTLVEMATAEVITAEVITVEGIMAEGTMVAMARARARAIRATRTMKTRATKGTMEVAAAKEKATGRTLKPPRLLQPQRQSPSRTPPQALQKPPEQGEGKGEQTVSHVSHAGGDS